jgi:hypothetical protein
VPAVVPAGPGRDVVVAARPGPHFGDLRMTKHWGKRKRTLAKAIMRWAEEDCEWGPNDPWVGDQTYGIMAEAAITVLRGMRDGERGMAKQGWEPEE